jgi:hypothetical protein
VVGWVGGGDVFAYVGVCVCVCVCVYVCVWGGAKLDTAYIGAETAGSPHIAGTPPIQMTPSRSLCRAETSRSPLSTLV